jgi:hypothetical protein
MVDRDPWQSLKRFSVVILIVIIALWVVYALTGRQQPPTPLPTGDTTSVPTAKP